MQEKSRCAVKYYGTTQGPKKTPLILKDFFVENWGVNDKSMGWGDISCEDRLVFLYTPFIQAASTDDDGIFLLSPLVAYAQLKVNSLFLMLARYS